MVPECGARRRTGEGARATHRTRSLGSCWHIPAGSVRTPARVRVLRGAQTQRWSGPGPRLPGEPGAGGGGAGWAGRGERGTERAWLRGRVSQRRPSQGHPRGAVVPAGRTFQMPATPRETVEAERGPCLAVAHTSCVTWGWTVAPHLSRPPPYCLRPGHAPMPSAHAAWGGGRGWGSLVEPPPYRRSVPTCGSGTPQSHLKTPRTASSPPAASHPALPAAVEMGMAPGAGPGPAAGQAGQGSPPGTSRGAPRPAQHSQRLQA